MSVFEQDVSTIANRTAEPLQKVFIVILLAAKPVEEFVKHDYNNGERSRPNRSQSVCLLRNLNSPREEAAWLVRVEVSSTAVFAPIIKSLPKRG